MSLPAPPAARREVPGSDPAGPEPTAPDLLTRQEASRHLALFHIQLKPASLARIWCVGGDGPPALHIGRRPYYPRDELEAWARRRRGLLRRSGRAPPDADLARP